MHTHTHHNYIVKSEFEMTLLLFLQARSTLSCFHVHHRSPLLACVKVSVWCSGALHNCPAAHASMDLTISMSCDTPLDTTIPTREQLGIRRNVSGHQSPTHLKHLVGEGASVHRWQLGGNFRVAMSQCLSSSLASETVAGRSGIIFISRLRGAPVLTC